MYFNVQKLKLPLAASNPEFVPDIDFFTFTSIKGPQPPSDLKAAIL